MPRNSAASRRRRGSSALTPSAVTQQIQSLELQRGVSLLSRMGRRILLTEAGERYFAMITDEVGRIAEATGTIRGFRSVTTLVVRATPTLSNKWLLPRLGAFLEFPMRCCITGAQDTPS